MIKSFRPFLAVEKYFDNTIKLFHFKCPHCGSNSCVKLDSEEPFNFWSGFFMCSNCGKSIYRGKEFNYYSDCFFSTSEPVQLSLF